MRKRNEEKNDRQNFQIFLKIRPLEKIQSLWMSNRTTVFDTREVKTRLHFTQIAFLQNCISQQKIICLNFSTTCETKLDRTQSY